MPKASGRTASYAADGYGIQAEIARLRDLGLEGLRARWQAAFRRGAPSHLPRHLLFAMIAYHLQADVLGGLDAETERFLKRMAQAPLNTSAIPLTQNFVRQRRRLAPGTVLSREWNSQHHRVMVLENGFDWEGRTYKSLSEIAGIITGTKWNGPRFFGLRDKKQAEATE